MRPERAVEVAERLWRPATDAARAALFAVIFAPAPRTGEESPRTGAGDEEPGEGAA